ncbi:MAG: 16S rRNA (cytosine(1402)-N(4))-methyltransferase RsmH [Bacteroidales bacterium]|nr:16S rRNA (cytosine(1402)-N(4))-methyltransferase RsmH [Bacteroidales bacterium]
MEQSYHRPVMLNESIEALGVRPDGVYVDATYGGGGHSRAILSLLGPEGRLIAFDQDPDARANAIDDTRFTLIGENFGHLRNFLRINGVRQIDGLLADLGVSSHQFDEPARGFSTRFDAPLDMRMDSRADTTAADLVANLTEADLTRLLRLYGELPNAARMAHDICAARRQEPIATTAQLRQAVSRQLPRGMENKYLAMLFQALRIEVNGELDALRALLEQAAALLVPGGRIAVISYHSLEDRIVKNYFRTGNFEGEPQKDFYGNLIRPLAPLQAKATMPSPEELAANNRSRSARLRAAQKNEPQNQ